MAKLSPRELLDRVRAVFQQRLFAKTSWGRNEVMAAFESATHQVVIDLLEAAWKEGYADNLDLQNAYLVGAYGTILDLALQEIEEYEKKEKAAK